jgi:hypothetical protein
MPTPRLLPSAGEQWARLSADFAACFLDVATTSVVALGLAAAEGFLSCFTIYCSETREVRYPGPRRHPP